MVFALCVREYQMKLVVFFSNTISWGRKPAKCYSSSLQVIPSDTEDMESANGAIVRLSNF